MPVNKAIIGSDSGLLSVWHQAIIQTNDDILLIGPLKTNCSDVGIKMQ